MGLLDSYPAFLTELQHAEHTYQKSLTPSKTPKSHSKTTKSLLLFLVIHQIYDVLLITQVKADSAAKQHIDQGNKLLAAGALSDALTHYNQAVDAEPENYQARYRRATCLLALGRSKAAVPDLDKTIQLKPEFWQARQQRANILLKQGKFDAAAKDYEACSIHSQEARNQLNSLKTTKQHFENAKVYANRGYHDRALKSLDKIKDVIPWSAEMRELRANCFELFGEIQSAINELKPMIQLAKSSAPETYLRLAKLYYIMPDVPQSLDMIRECLKIDPDHKLCFAFYKVAKKLNKQLDAAKKKLQNEEYEEALGKIDAALGTTENHEALLSPPSNEFLNHLHFQKCRIHHAARNHEKAIHSCQEARNHEAALMLLAKIYEEIEDYQSAIHILKSLPKSDDILEKITMLEKRVNQPRDYYKILQVGRNVDLKTVKKQYKKLAIIYHPDRCGKNELTEGWPSEKCEKAFRDIADAKEVLSDEEKKRQFDSGMDPLNPEGQNQGAGWNDMRSHFQHFHHDFDDNFQEFGGFQEFGSFFRGSDNDFQETFDYHFDTAGFW